MLWCDIAANGNEGILSMAAYVRDWLDIFIITVGYNLQGPGGVVNIVAAGPFLTAGGLARVEPSSESLSATSPLFTKVIMLQRAGAPAGDYDLPLSVAAADGGGAVVARTVRVSVVPITFTANFELHSPSYDRQTRSPGMTVLSLLLWSLWSPDRR
jgi:hypothetical protein